jgi:hypothetical protein
MLEGHRVAVVSNKEIEILSSGIVEPFSVEDELNQASGGKYEKADKPFTGRVVISEGTGRQGDHHRTEPGQRYRLREGHL